MRQIRIFMKDFGTPVAKIDSPRGESFRLQTPLYLLPSRLRTKKLGQDYLKWLTAFETKFFASLELVNVGLANFPAPSEDYQSIRG